MSKDNKKTETEDLTEEMVTGPETSEEVILVEDLPETVCEEFTVVGRGKGKSKKQAIKVAHEDAADTAKAECKTNEYCSAVSLVSHEEVDAEKADKGYKAVVIDRFQCIL
jgi:hypothetical protein